MKTLDCTRTASGNVPLSVRRSAFGRAAPLAVATLLGAVAFGAAGAGFDGTQAKAPETAQQSDATGQNGANAPGTAPRAAGKPTAEVRLISVSFPGGTTKQYVDLLRREAGEEAVNVIMSEAAAAARLSPFSLRNVAVETAIKAIEAASGNASGSWDIHLVRAFSNQDVPLVYAVDHVPKAGQAPRTGMDPRLVGQEGPERIQVFSLRDLIVALPGSDPSTVLDSEAVLSAVQQAVSMAVGDEHPMVELRFHEDAGLLIAKGTPSDLSIVAQAINEMSSDLRRRRAAEPSEDAREKEAMEVETQLRSAELDRELTEVRAQSVEEMASRAKQLVDAGQLSRDDATKLLADVRASEIERRQAQVRIDALKRRLDMLREGTATGPISLAAFGDKWETVTGQVLSAATAINAAAGNNILEIVVDGGPRTVLPKGDPAACAIIRRIVAERTRVGAGDNRSGQPETAKKPAPGK